MPRKCPHDPKKLCSQPKKDCLNCEYRKTVQKILTEEPPSQYKLNIEILSKNVTCPYCLFTEQASKFTITNKSGKISEKRFKCPDCGEVMRQDTLFSEKSVEQFAEWILDTEAWGRISFNKFKARLKEMGISSQFWEHYRKYKADMVGSTEPYEEYLMRQQEEEHYADMHGE